MQQLLDAGADPQMQSGGKTALQHAMQCAFSLSYPACLSLDDLDSYSRTDMFECLLEHSSLQLTAAELVSTAWSLAGAEHWDGHAMQPRPDDQNMPNWLDYTDEEVSRARPRHQLCSPAEALFKGKAQQTLPAPSRGASLSHCDGVVANMWMLCSC
jgi:hypothetical protein